MLTGCSCILASQLYRPTYTVIRLRSHQELLIGNSVRDLRNEKGFGEQWLWTCIARSTCVFGWNRPGKQHPSSFKIEKCFQLQGGFAPWSPDQGLCPWTPLGAKPADAHYRLALRALAMSSSTSAFLVSPLTAPKAVLPICIWVCIWDAGIEEFLRPSELIGLDWIGFSLSTTFR